MTDMIDWPGGECPVDGDALVSITKIGLLKKARSRIECGLNWTICAATRDAEGRHDTSAGIAIRKLVMARIAPYVTVAQWLTEHVPEARRMVEKWERSHMFKRARETAWGKAQIAYRLRWIDHLIAELEAKGESQ